MSSPASWPLSSSPSFCLMDSSRIPFYYYKNIVSMVLKKQNALVHHGLFPFYFTFCFQRTWKYSSTAALMHIQIIIIHIHAFKVWGSLPSSVFSFRKKGGILVALQAACVCVKLSSYCRVVQSVMFNLCIPVLYNFHIYTIHACISTLIFLHVYLFVYILHKCTYTHIISITGYST